MLGWIFHVNRPLTVHQAAVMYHQNYWRTSSVSIYLQLILNQADPFCIFSYLLTLNKSIKTKANHIFPETVVKLQIIKSRRHASTNELVRPTIFCTIPPTPLTLRPTVNETMSVQQYQQQQKPKKK